MNKTQEQTLEILKGLVEKQKKAIGKKDNEISKLHEIINIEEKLQEELEELKNELEETKLFHCNNSINCGIGIINFQNPSNLQLDLLMEALESSINKQGSLFVLEALQILSE